MIHFTPTTIKQADNRDYTIVIPENLKFHTPPPTTIDTLQTLEACRNSNRCRRLFELLLVPFNWAWEKLSKIFSSISNLAPIPSFLLSPEAAINPQMLSQWDPVIEKNYDPVGAPNPYYAANVSNARRGTTIADHLVKALAKTTVAPRFKHIIIYEIYNAGHLFSADGQFGRLHREAGRGEFNSPDTLIIFAAKNSAFADPQGYIRGKIAAMANDGYPIQNAKFATLTPRETGTISNSQRIPKWLLEALAKGPSGF